MFRNFEKNKSIINKAISKKTLLIITASTTSFGPSAEIIELSAIKNTFDGSRFVPHDVLHLFFHSNKKITDACRKMHGINKEDIEHAMSIEQAKPFVDSFFKDAGTAVYYSDFCGEIIKKNFPSHFPESSFDMKQMAKDLLWSTQLTSHKLETVAITYGIDVPENYMRSTDSARILANLLNKFIDEMTEGSRLEEKLWTPFVRSVGTRKIYHGQTRLYANLDIGTIYYDVLKDVWIPKDNVDLKLISLQEVVKQILNNFPNDVEEPIRRQLCGN